MNTYMVKKEVETEVKTVVTITWGTSDGHFYTCEMEAIDAEICKNHGNGDEMVDLTSVMRDKQAMKLLYDYYHENYRYG